jgi:hypothetical protein
MKTNYKINNIFERYLKGKIASNKHNKDNRPFTKRELHLIRVSFMAGFSWQKYFIEEDDEK